MTDPFLDYSIYEPFIDLLGAIFGGLGILTIIVGVKYFSKVIPLFGRDEDLEENFAFAIFSLALGTACFAVAIFGTLAIHDLQAEPEFVHWFSVLLASVMGVTLVARAIKEFPMTKVVALGFIALLVITTILFIAETEITLLDQEISLWPFTAALALVIGVLVVLSFFTEHTIDFFMGFIGHPIIQAVVGVIAILHGVALFAILDEESEFFGLWHYLKDYFE